MRRRTGIPEDVGALVEKMTGDEVTVVLVNISQVDERTVVVQGGAYGEHQLISVAVEDRVHPIGHPFLSVRLAPGSGARLVLRTKRYANQPTLAFPWV